MGFHSTAFYGMAYNQVFVVEAITFVMIMYRLITLFRLNHTVYLLWHTVGIALKGIMFVAIMFLPTIFGFAFLGQAVWGKSMESFSHTAFTITTIYSVYS